jgi:hypothetical protein
MARRLPNNRAGSRAFTKYGARVPYEQDAGFKI